MFSAILVVALFPFPNLICHYQVATHGPVTEIPLTPKNDITDARADD
jgi:hypothetical protein